MQVSALRLFKASENESYWSRLIKTQFVLYFIVFVVLSSKYGENEHFKETKSFSLQFLNTISGHIASQSKAFHNGLIP